MKKDYYMHQKFLLDCDYESVSLSDPHSLQEIFVQDFSEPINLFDTEDSITRKVKFSYLLKEIDTKEDLVAFMGKTEFVDNLLIENDMPRSENPIVADYQEACLKAFYEWLKELSLSFEK